ncbi:MAG TPA: RidA family protein [Candidatus Angelobacter sp.]|jgi:enamine deaminase RidA (YjgF/YER057c/UK114 family)|nr:RidA family protein [Candidatus Angelobacter sp.]
MKVLQPANWKRPRGYSNGVAAKGHVVFISGMVGWNAQEEFTSVDLAGQVRQALANIVEVLSEANAKPTDIVRMTWYLIDKQEYLAAAKEIGAAYREIIGKHYPAMTVVQVSALLEDKARVEIEVTAVVPE